VAVSRLGGARPHDLRAGAGTSARHIYRRQYDPPRAEWRVPRL